MKHGYLSHSEGKNALLTPLAKNKSRSPRIITATPSRLIYEIQNESKSEAAWARARLQLNIM